MPRPPVLIALAGPNGAGKSSIGRALIRDVFGVDHYIDADPIARGLSGFAPDQVARAAGRIMLDRITELAAQRRSFAVETTLAGRTYGRRVESVIRQGYAFHLVFVRLSSPGLAVARVAARVRAGGHGVPADVIHRRFRRGLRNFFEVYIPLAASWRVYDNSGSPPPRRVAARVGPGPAVIDDEATWAEIRSAAGCTDE